MLSYLGYAWANIDTNLLNADSWKKVNDEKQVFLRGKRVHYPLPYRG
ncbi:MAG: hypothetical protein RIR11_3122 [Bacteroidota bacterium]|jgi:hypothetical protein